MRPSRRAVLATGGALVLQPGWARAVDLSAEEQMRLEGRYLPRWLELLDEVGERRRVLELLGAEHAEHVGMIMRDGRSQYAAFLGDEATAFGMERLSTTAPDPSTALVARDAIEAIVEASRGHRVVMLNEGYVSSRHRALLARLIRALDAEGFTHLAAEAFSEAVGSLRAGDPVGFSHGWYVRDPVFAEAAREALDLGWGLVPYEQREDQRSQAPGLSDAATVLREQVQADNLRAALDTNPDMRVLVFVSYGHLREVGRPFGARLKHDTGIDPLTVGQAGVGAFGPRVEDAPPVKALLERFKPDWPVVLLKPGEAPTSAATDADLTSEDTDLIVLHPALADVEGRPHWLAGDPARRRLALSVPAGKGTRLVQAIHAADPDPAIPADQYLISDKAGQSVLWLRPGAYRLRLETTDGFVPLGEGAVT